MNLLLLLARHVSLAAPAARHALFAPPLVQPPGPGDHRVPPDEELCMSHADSAEIFASYPFPRPWPDSYFLGNAHRDLSLCDVLLILQSLEVARSSSALFTRCLHIH